MATYSLSTYRLRIRRRRPQEQMELDNFDGAGTDFLYVLADFFNDLQLSGLNNLESKKECFRLGGLPVATDRRIRGIIDSGSYGIKEDIVNTDSGSTSHTKTPKEASLTPFYFSFQVQKKSKDCIVILQRYKQFGVKSHLIGLLSTWFSKNYRGYMLEIEYLIPGEYAEKLLNGSLIKRLTFVKFGIPKDVADEYVGADEPEGRVEMSVIPRRNGFLPLTSAINKLFDPQGNKSVKTLFAFDEEIKGFDYDNIKVTISSGGAQRTIDLSHLMDVRADYDIDNVPRDENGHLVFSAVDAYAANMCEELRKAIHQDNPDALIQDEPIVFNEIEEKRLLQSAD